MIIRSENRVALVTFTTAFVTLAAQILFHRIISAKLLNNFAFFVISLTMLGFACSGVILSRRLKRWEDNLEETIVWWASAFIASTFGATLLFYRADFSMPYFTNRSQFWTIIVEAVPYALLFAVPFIFSGLILGLLLSNPRYPARKIYCWDLVGSACGALAVAPAINSIGVETSLLLACGLLIISTFVLIPRCRPFTSSVRLAAMAAIILSIIFQQSLFSLRYPQGTQLAAASNPNSGVAIEYVRWDATARIEVSRIPPPDPTQMAYPALIGSNKTFLSHFKRCLTQNNYAFTYAVEYDGKPESLEGIQETIYSAAYVAQATNKPKVAIIGVGGGFDILTALHFNAANIVGVEVNHAVLKVLKEDYADYFGAWTKDPRVKLVYDDGRHFLKSTAESFDIVQLSGVDSFSGTPGAAHVFSESYLYTEEAFELYLSRLNPNGILNVMRMEEYPAREMLRIVATAVAALKKSGVSDPAKHLALISEKGINFMALLVKKTPFTRDELDKLTAWVAPNPYLEFSFAPDRASKIKTPHRMFIELPDGAENEFYKMWSYNIQPATDDSPFFFNFSRWSHLPILIKFSPWGNWPSMQTAVPAMQITLVVMFLAVGVITLLCVWLPLRSIPYEGVPATRRRLGAVFAGTALGYLGIEIALMQRLGLYLGHPNYALSVVLAGLLFSTGIGALYSSDLCRWLRGPRFVSYALVFFVIIETQFAFPALQSLGLQSFIARAVVVLVQIFPLGLLMGVFIPTAINQMKDVAPNLVPWAWGVNGAFSVIAPILSIALSMSFGIDLLLLSATSIYLVVGWVFPKNQSESLAKQAV